MTFSAALGEAGKQKGMERAARAADPEWMIFMYATLIEVAKRKQYFFTDDLEFIRRARNGPSTHENRALGPLMRSAQRDLICEPTDRWAPSMRANCHRRPMRIWLSLIYKKR